MAQTSEHLNLARKWRPKTFDQVVGQDISIKMLKNSLFLKKVFPVYLFAGQRGCGKTSTARIFASAVNCAQLNSFQEDPKSNTLPCLSCDSCAAMLKGEHPDFIEIDAASHTGVDNVRQIIDASNYMPLVGKKKIYLIDEAHMLSRAAFNAFLKILEEPPASVLFILATTELQKIPQTVLSRCFQLVFNPIDHQKLKGHLKMVCEQEQVAIEDGALDLLLDETEGSVRDAINLLEQVRFSSDHVTHEAVLHVLGKISGKDIVRLLSLLIEQKPDQVLNFLQEINFESRSAQNLWDMVVKYCRYLVWIKFGVKTLPVGIEKFKEELGNLARKCSVSRLTAMLQLLWSGEELFLRTSKKHIFLEMVFLDICGQVNVVDLQDLIKTSKGDGVRQVPTQSSQIPQKVVREDRNVDQQKSSASFDSVKSEWSDFLQQIQSLQDPLLRSILEQAAFVKEEKDKRTVVVRLSSDSLFFKNKIKDTKLLWQPLLKKVFSGCNDFLYAESLQENTNQLVGNPSHTTGQIRAQANGVAQPMDNVTPASQQRPGGGVVGRRGGQFLVIKDTGKWPKVSLLLRHFPGKVKLV